MSEQQQQRVPSSYDQMFPGRFLKAGELGGKAVTLRVKAVYLEELPKDNGDMEMRGILSFERTAKELTVNVTNRKCLEAMFGEDPRALIGKRITFVPEKDRFGKDIVGAIRIKGSPDIAEPIDVVIKLRRKRPRNRTLVPTGNGGDRTSAPQLVEDEPPEAIES